MKIAVLADIHGNLPALETVTHHIDSWAPDAVVVAGDVVNRGPRSRECLEFAHKRQEADGWQVVRGNHEEYVLDQARPEAPRSGPLFDISQNASWTYQQLDGQVDTLISMPFQVSLTGPDGGEVRIVHASMDGNRAGIYPESSDDEIRGKIAPAPEVICVGHTHRPLVRRVDQTLAVNVGSVGIPFDGDIRPSYAQLSWKEHGWRAEIVRLDYDQDAAENDYFSSGFLDGGGPLTSLMLVEFRQARSHIHFFFSEHEKAIMAGEISLEDAVNQYLAARGLSSLSST